MMVSSAAHLITHFKSNRDLKIIQQTKGRFRGLFLCARLRVMFEKIDIYCERTDFTLWAEPLNALTNAAFFVAAAMLYLLAKRESALDWKSVLLIGLIVVIGTGSTLFHTLATVWAMLSDSLPILAFQICFIVLYCRFVLNWNCWRSGAMLGAFFVAMGLAMNAPRGMMNGSVEYLPALFFVALLGLFHLKHAASERFGLLLAAGIFIVSVTLRSIDRDVCAAIPIGTHFLWHCLNGCVLYASARAFILNRK